LKLVLATRNADKLREIGEILADLRIRLLSLADFPGLPEVAEDGETFEENALKKAYSCWKETGEMSLGDDSGLEVDELGGAPGVLSARFAGENASYEENNQKLLSLLEGVSLERRSAAFVCVIAVMAQDGSTEVFRGSLRGSISTEPKGSSGFGYDPLFLVPEFGRTLAELGEETKNRISHRAAALFQAREHIRRLLGSAA
jgi:XTP/dITP diphosphohydrolase